MATDPERGSHFHTGARLAAILGYPVDWIEKLPPAAVTSMAGTGNPFALGEMEPASTSSTAVQGPGSTR